MSQRRGISDEERALFRSALKDVEPLARRARALIVPPKTPRMAPAPRIEPPDYLNRPAPLIGGHRHAQLRRARGEPQARLALPGITHEAAYRSLDRLLVAPPNQGQHPVLAGDRQ